MFSALCRYWNLTRRRAREGHLPVARQLFEMSALFLFRGIGPGYYHGARLWRRGVPLADKLAHLSGTGYRRRIAQVNHPDYRKLSQYKVAEKAMLSLFAIPTPRFHGYFHPIDGGSRLGAPLRDADDLAALLLTARPARICFKPVEGFGGLGFQAADVVYEDEIPRLRPLPDGDPLDVATFVDQRLGGTAAAAHVVEDYCAQHPWYAAFNPTSVNTFRIYVTAPTRNQVCIHGGYLRLGRAGSIVDNVFQGGIIAPFDPETGVLEPAFSDGPDREYYEEHPDSGVRIAGRRLPLFRELRPLIERTIRVFPHIRFAGFDIAMTASGPVIVELNVQPAPEWAWDLDVPTSRMLALREGGGAPAASPRGSGSPGALTGASADERAA